MDREEKQQLVKMNKQQQNSEVHRQDHSKGQEGQPQIEKIQQQKKNQQIVQKNVDKEVNIQEQTQKVQQLQENEQQKQQLKQQINQNVVIDEKFQNQHILVENMSSENKNAEQYKQKNEENNIEKDKQVEKEEQAIVEEKELEKELNEKQQEKKSEQREQKVDEKEFKIAQEKEQAKIVEKLEERMEQKQQEKQQKVEQQQEREYLQKKTDEKDCEKQEEKDQLIIEKEDMQKVEEKQQQEEKDRSEEKQNKENVQQQFLEKIKQNSNKEQEEIVEKPTEINQNCQKNEIIQQNKEVGQQNMQQIKKEQKIPNEDKQQYRSVCQSDSFEKLATSLAEIKLNPQSKIFKSKITETVRASNLPQINLEHFSSQVITQENCNFQKSEEQEISPRKSKIRKNTGNKNLNQSPVKIEADQSLYPSLQQISKNNIDNDPEKVQKIDKEEIKSEKQQKQQINSMQVILNQSIFQKQKQVQNLSNHISNLKQQIIQLQRKKKQQNDAVQLMMNKKKRLIQEQVVQSPIRSLKDKKQQFLGKIYKISPNKNSRVSENIQTPKDVDNQDDQISHDSSQKKQFSSTMGFKKKNEEKINNINFRVKKKSKVDLSNDASNKSLRNEQENNYQKSSKGQKQNSIKNKTEQDFGNLEFSQEEKLDVDNTQRKSQRKNLSFRSNFRQEVQNKQINIGYHYPSQHWSQQDLIQLAKTTFIKFGLNLLQQNNPILNVKKYKNCVSFVYDSQRTILWYYDGKFYFGGWIVSEFNEGEKAGQGYELIPQKYIYIGQYQNNKRNGYGIIKFLTKENDVIFEGDWLNGYKHGYGRQIEADNIEYIGDWFEGKRHGYGTVKISQNQTFEGDFVKGLKNGKGTQKFKNGDIYQGSYLNGKFHGKGTYLWYNLSKYDGQFRDGMRNGNGVWYSNYLEPQSDKYDGQYLNDKKNGYGIYTWKDGTIYKGEFLNDLKHGEGQVIYSNGKFAKLNWFQGNVVNKNKRSPKEPRSETNKVEGNIRLKSRSHSRRKTAENPQKETYSKKHEGRQINFRQNSRTQKL